MDTHLPKLAGPKPTVRCTQGQMLLPARAQGTVR